MPFYAKIEVMSGRIARTCQCLPTEDGPRRHSLENHMTEQDEIASFAVPQAIAETLQRYLDGLRTGQADMLRSAFTEGARVSGSYDGRPVSWSLTEFCELVAKGGPARGLEGRIVSIDHAGNAASARLELLNLRGTRYTDFFVLVQHDGAWRLDSKIFFAHRRA